MTSAETPCKKGTDGNARQHRRLNFKSSIFIIFAATSSSWTQQLSFLDITNSSLDNLPQTRATTGFVPPDPVNSNPIPVLSIPMTGYTFKSKFR